MPFLIFNIEGGDILCKKDVRPRNMPPGYDFILSVEPCCLNSNRIEGRRVVPKGMQERRAVERADVWTEVRRVRARLLDETDKMLAPDYPLGWRAKRALKKRRKISRNITEMTSDPREALRILKKAWGLKDVE